MSIQVQDTNPSAPSRARGGFLNAAGVDQGDGTAAVVVAMRSGVAIAGQTRKRFVGSITLSGSAQSIALETVAAGKTLTITDIVLHSTDATGGAVSIDDGSTAIFTTYVSASQSTSATGFATGPQIAGGDAASLVVPAGSGTLTYAIYGIEQ